MGVRFESLAIIGHGGEPVPHRFLRQDAATTHLAIVLPGFGYGCDGPLLYYPANLLLDAGADVLLVEYAYNRRPDYAALADADRRRWLRADVAAACDAVLTQRSYERITLIGKSLGTIAMAQLLAADARFVGADAVWLTPVLTESGVWEGIARGGRRALVAIGTDDHFYDATRLAEARSVAGLTVVVVEGADHSLDIAGDVPGSLAALERTVRAVGAALALPVGS